MPNSLIVLFTGMLLSFWMVKPLVSKMMTNFRNFYLLFAITGVVNMLSPYFIGSLLRSGRIPFFQIFLLLGLMLLSTVVFCCAKELYVKRFVRIREQVLSNRINTLIFYVTSVIGQGFIISFAALAEIKYKRIPFAWSYTYYFIAALEALLLVAILIVFRKADNSPLRVIERSKLRFSVFIRENWKNLLLLLSFLLPNICIMKVRPFFFIDRYFSGGLELTLFEVGFVQGTIGIIAFSIGNILGHYVRRRRRNLLFRPFLLLWFMPPLMYLLMSYFQMESLVLVSVIVFFNQFCIGMGLNLVAFFLPPERMEEYRQTGNNVFTLPVVIFVTLIPSLFVGYAQEAMGYLNLFLLLFCISIVVLTYILYLKYERKTSI